MGDYNSQNRNFDNKKVLDSVSKVDLYISSILNYYSINSSKLVLMGFSQGSILSLRVGLGRKEKLGGIMGYSGSFISEENFKPSSFPPVCLFHGEKDNIIPYRMLKKI